jgi:hypothetical protein
MTAIVIQKSFSSGEWAPELNARVDLAKYHSAAALLRNFFVDYRGGASSRPGTKYILQAFKSAKKVRLIPFQASFIVNYVLEFGDFYIRFFVNGGPVLEATTAITGVTNANPGVITDATHGYSTGDWVLLNGIGGTTQLNGNYYIVQRINANSYSLTDLFGVAVDTTAFGVYTSGGTAQRVYTLTSPYAAADLALVKFTQNVSSLILCHPSYPPQVLTIVSAANWTISAINFSATIGAPTIASVTSTASSGGGWNTAYAVTAVDVNGQESPPSPPVGISNNAFLGLPSAPVTYLISWAAIPGAVSYNVYRSAQSLTTAVQAGAQFGFIGNVTGVTTTDAGYTAPDFSQTPPIPQNPFQGAGVQSYTVTAAGSYGSNVAIPTVSIAAPPAGGYPASAYASLGCISFTGSAAGLGYSIGSLIQLPGGVVLRVTAIGAGGSVTTAVLASAGGLTGAVTPTNPVADTNPGGKTPATFNITWGLLAVISTQLGAGYISVPAVTISSGGGTATAILATTSGGNPSVPGFFDERLVLAAQPLALQSFNMSQPGSPYNFNTNNPTEADDAISGSIVSGKLNAIRSMLNAPTGLIMFTSQQAWLVNGGSPGAAVTPIDIDAKGHAYNGASDVPPIQVNFDYLYVQAKGSKVRDLTYNFYTNIYTGTDISVLSSHLFFGYQITEWAWSEEPFALVWAVRNDGVLLSLTFVKEQETVGWGHHDTNGLFQSIASVTEAAETAPGSTVVANVDAVYVVVQRTVNSQTLQYIERMADRFPQDGYKTCWAVDAGLQYSGAPATVFTGLQHLTGMAVVGLADGIPFTATVSATGSFTLGTAASLVTAGLKFIPQLQTLAIDVGDPTIQSKLKNIPFSSLRVRSTLGLSMGRNFSTLTAMKDLVLNNVNSMASGLPASQQKVTDLWTGDARTFMDSAFTTAGQYCIEQDQPYYATVLGTIPALTVGG